MHYRANATAAPAPVLYNSASDPEFKRAVRLRESGQLAKAALAFARLAREAHGEGNTAKETRVLLAEGGIQLRQFAYRDAAENYQRVLKLARHTQDSRSAGAAYINLAEIHIQLNDLAAAEREARSGIALLSTGKNTTALIRAELQLGRIQTAQGQVDEARKVYKDAITLAADANDTEDECLAWIILGQALAGARDLHQAEDAYLQAYRIALLHKSAQLDTVRAMLMELEWSKGNPAESMRRLDLLLATTTPEQLGIAEYQLFYQRAEMLAALSREQEALATYRQAVAAATKWRRGALPGEVANASSVALIHEIYAQASDFVAELGKRRSNPDLQHEALEMIATNRAADLREQRTLAWHRDGMLPARYYQLLNQLRTAEADSILSETRKKEVDGLLRQTRVDLGLLETQVAMEAGNSFQTTAETFDSQKRLVDIQRALGDDDALFSFSLGKRRSWLWVVTRTAFGEFELPDGPTLVRSAAEWAARVRADRKPDGSGIRLSRELLGQVPEKMANKRNWLVVNDGSLLINFPLAALPDIRRQPEARMSDDKRRDPIPLVENHRLRYLSSEFSLTSHSSLTTPPLQFAGIGDPVYNMADIRYKSARTPDTAPLATTTTLARLVGSGSEVRGAAALFTGATVLTGMDAVPERLPALFKTRPSVVHFAVHVVSPADRPEEAALAMSVGRDRFPELLTPELIATYRVPGSLIVMSGCDSQQGKAVPGVGVKGLSRAWLLAGASAVLTSAWPMPDDDGRFFRSFYRHLGQSFTPEASLPDVAAAALADAQNEMRSATSFRREPSFWAAYTVISKE
jgi:CHAT domain-containing protein/tetratricopeptide (TPR) repeat protein